MEKEKQNEMSKLGNQFQKSMGIHAAHPPSQNISGIDLAALAKAPSSEQKQILGEKLFTRIMKVQPELAGKITSMLLELDNAELLKLLEQPDELKIKVDEAVLVFQPYLPSLPGAAKPEPGRGMAPCLAASKPVTADAPSRISSGIDVVALAKAPSNEQKQMLGEKLFPLIMKFEPELAGKVTGMLLEIDNAELLVLLEQPDQLKAKVDEATCVIEITYFACVFAA